MQYHLIRDDITKMEVDAIVVPTNKHLFGVEGIDGLVHEAGGEELDTLCRSFAPRDTGDALITPAFNLPCRKIVHLPVPEWEDGYSGERILLRQCYENGLKKAFEDTDIHTLAVPLLGSGNNQCPMDIAFNIAVESLKSFQTAVKKRRKAFTVWLVMYSEESMAEVYRILSHITENIDDEYAKTHSNLGPRPKKRSPRAASAEDVMFQKFMSIGVPLKTESLETALKSKTPSFQKWLDTYICRSGRKETEIYKEAGLTKSHYNKLKKEGYNVQKRTALDLAVALHLNMDEAEEFLSTAGYAFSPSSTEDRIYSWHIRNGKWDVEKIRAVVDMHAEEE